jgi:two-component system nitrate/nitrite response regulator NarL
MATVAILASGPLFRAGLASLLHTMGFSPVEQAADITELQRQFDNGISPEILLINLSHETEIAISADKVKAWASITKVVFLAADFDLGLLSGYFAAGASGYLLEKISADAFEESIRLVRAGEKVFPSELASLIPGFASISGAPIINAAELGNSKLSDREIDILRCLTNGQSNKAIANTLNIAESTVKVHVKRILQKTHATNRTQAALWGAARGVAPESSFMLHKVAS